ncbi:uncharacterized protein C6G9.01c [Rutidosis leptorrhynchoides]|uniref:uncharacterized protein C6G9.01c n=1 Tax=Rutidosis leptorrhynchoides TaxID=125765 RepID=UPI003A99962E
MPKKNSSNTSKPGLKNPAVASWEISKKSSSKQPKPALQKPSVPKEKPSSTTGTFGQEIDDIFSKKRKKPEQQKTKKRVQSVAGKPTKMNKETGEDSKDVSSVTRKNKRNNSEGSNVDMFESEQTARPKRKTADGLAIYKEEELGIGRADAGGTRLCPFDCDCCF